MPLKMTKVELCKKKKKRKWRLTNVNKPIL